ncbi:SIR2 family protein [Archangium violaceum]|nr:SIR2 family protein [Archangium violaceum]
MLPSSSSTHSAIMTLREAYTGGTLKTLVGPGVSCASGLPPWEELNARLLRAFLQREYKHIKFQLEDLKKAARVFIESFGYEAVADLIRESVTKATPDKDQGTYNDMLRESLYDERGGTKAESDLHLELAASLGDIHPKPLHERKRILYTFNFDNLLEQALWRLFRLKAQTRYPDDEQGTQDSPAVHHLLGYLPTNGAPRGSIILSETDYHARQARLPNELKQLFLGKYNLTGSPDNKPVVLLVGLNPTDPRLRGVLQERRRELCSAGREASSQPRIYALLHRRPPPTEAELIERMAHDFVQEHEEPFWKAWGINVLTVESGELLPFLLRQIRLGPRCTDWAQAGRNFLSAQADRYTEHLYNGSVQRPILERLKKACAVLRQRFGVAADEQLGLAGFVPDNKEASLLRLAFRFSNGRVNPEPITHAYAMERSMRVTDIDKPGGSVSRAFIWGATLEDSYQGSSVDKSCAAQWMDEWARERIFASLLCVPVYDSKQWVPVGVCCLYSNQRIPFWSELTALEMDELKNALQSIFARALRIRGRKGSPCMHARHPEGAEASTPDEPPWDPLLVN